MINFSELSNEAKLASLNPDTTINDKYVLQSLFFVNKCRIENIDDAFLVFAAHNYLNFAVKIGEYKKLIGYFFKAKLVIAINKCLDKKLNIQFSLQVDNNMPILYVSFAGFIFSFHNPTNLQEIASKLNDDITFDNIYKQKCASMIFEKAKHNEDLSLDLAKLGG